MSLLAECSACGARAAGRSPTGDWCNACGWMDPCPCAGSPPTPCPFHGGHEHRFDWRDESGRCLAEHCPAKLGFWRQRGDRYGLFARFHLRKMLAMRCMRSLVRCVGQLPKYYAQRGDTAARVAQLGRRMAWVELMEGPSPPPRRDTLRPGSRVSRGGSSVVDWSKLSAEEVLEARRTMPEVAGAWQSRPCRDGRARWLREAHDACEGEDYAVVEVYQMHRTGERCAVNFSSREVPEQFATVDEAKSAADRKLREAGWKLVGDPPPVTP